MQWFWEVSLHGVIRDSASCLLFLFPAVPLDNQISSGWYRGSIKQEAFRAGVWDKQSQVILASTPSGYDTWTCYWACLCLPFLTYAMEIKQCCCWTIAGKIMWHHPQCLSYNQRLAGHSKHGSRFSAESGGLLPGEDPLRFPYYSCFFAHHYLTEAQWLPCLPLWDSSRDRGVIHGSPASSSWAFCKLATCLSHYSLGILQNDSHVTN